MLWRSMTITGSNHTGETVLVTGYQFYVRDVGDEAKKSLMP